MASRWPRNMQAALYYNRKRRRSRIDTETAPVDTDSDLWFGGLNLAGSGGVKARDEEGNEIGFASIDSIDSGDGTGWSIVDETLVRSGSTPASSHGAVFTCTLTNDQQIAFTINASGLDPLGRDLSTAYNYRDDTELAAIHALGVATLSGKSIIARPGRRAWVNAQWDDRAYTSLTYHGGEFADQSSSFSVRSANAANLKNIHIDNFEFYYTHIPGTDSQLLTGIEPSGIPDNVTISNCRTNTNVVEELGFVVACRGAWDWLGCTDVGPGGITMTDITIDGCVQGIRWPRNPSSGPIRCSNVEFLNMGSDEMLFSNGGNMILSDIKSSQPFANPDEWDMVAGGHTTYLEKVGGFTGAADSKTATFHALWMFDNTSAVDRYIYVQGTAFLVWLDSTNHLRVTAQDTTAATAVDMTSTSTYTAGTQLWLGIVVTLDTDGTHRLDVWENASRSWTLEASQAGGGETLDLSAGDVRINNPLVSPFSNGSSARRIAFWPGVHVDMSLVASKALFIDTNDLAYRASTALATASLGTPILDITSLASARDGTNEGSGGDLAVSPGAIIEQDHPDVFQGIANNPAGPISITRVLVIDDRFDGIPARRNKQIAFFHDNPDDQYSNITISGMIALHSRSHLVSLYNSTESVVYGVSGLPNTDAMADDTVSSLYGRIRALSYGTEVSEDNSFTDNLCGEIVGADTLDENNYIPALASVSDILTDLETVLDWDWTTDVPETFDELIASAQPRAGAAMDVYPEVGASTKYFDFVNKTTDHPRFNTPSAFDFSDQSDVEVSTRTVIGPILISSVTKEEGGASTQGALFKISGDGSPNIKVSSDSAGLTPVFDWRADPCVIKAGEYAWIDVTSSGSNSTAIPLTVTIGDTTDTCTVTTEVGTGLPVFRDSIGTGDIVFDATQDTLLPVDVEVGDIIVVVQRHPGNNANTTAATDRDWTVIYNSTVSTNRLTVYAKEADAQDVIDAEAGTPTDLYTSGSSFSSSVAFAFSNHSGVANVEATVAAATSNPPSHTPSGGSGDYAIIAGASSERGDNTFTAGPAGYTNLTVGQAGTSSSSGNSETGAGITDLASGASVDPGDTTFVNTTANLVAFTISIRGPFTP